MNVPSFIGRYRIAGRLAIGGMAEVFLAMLEGPGGFRKPVVIKKILPKLAARRTLRQLFLNEARAIASFQHPNVVQVFELGCEEHELYLVMEYLAGENVNQVLRALHKQGRRFGYAMAASVVCEAAKGLHFAHEHRDEAGSPLRLVHRDVSPENVIITYDGAVKVIDFGIVQSDVPNDPGNSLIKGKPAYMSPEQTIAGGVDRRADIFGLGIVLFEMTTGRRLFRRSTDQETFDAVRYAPIPRPREIDPAYPAALEAICLRALERDVNQRYQSAAEMATELDRISEQSLSDATRASLMNQLFANRRRQKSELLRRVERCSISSALGMEGSSVDEGSYAVTGAERRGWHSYRWAALVLPLFLIAAVGAWLGIDSRPDALSASGESSTEVPALTEREPVALPSRATVHVVTTPPGATIKIGRMTRVSPAEFILEQSAEPLVVMAALEGHATVYQQIIPRTSRAMSISMHAIGRKQRRRDKTKRKKSRRRPKSARAQVVEPTSFALEPAREFYRFD